MSEIKLPTNWCEVKIEELFDTLSDGRTLHQGWSPQCESGPCTVDSEWGVLKTTAIQSGRFESEHHKRLPDHLSPRELIEVHLGDLLITCAGPRVRCGVVCLVKRTRNRLLISGKMYRFRANPRVVEPRYLEAFLLSDDSQQAIDSMKTGGSESGLNLTHDRFRQLIVRLAPHSEQIRIIAKLEELLSDLDAGVAELKAAQSKLGQYRQSLLKAAVDGSLTAEWRKSHTPAESGAQLLERILTERRKRWESKQLAKFQEQGKTPPKGWQDRYPHPVSPDTTNLPKLPEGWVWATVDQVSESIRNGLSQKPSQDPIGYPILRINAVRPMAVNLSEVRYLNLAGDEAKAYILDDGDLLATRYNGSVDLLGVFGVVRGSTKQTVHPDKLIRVKPVLSVGLADWIEISANVGQSRKFLLSRIKTTAGQTGISGDDLKKIPVPLPPSDEQKAAAAIFGESATSYVTQTHAMEILLKQAIAQRKNILKAAFSGKLVHQDPNDEPASVLLERIRASAKSQERVKRAGKPKA